MGLPVGFFLLGYSVLFTVDPYLCFICFLSLDLQSNLGYSNVDYPKLLGYSKSTDSPDFFLYYL